MTPRAFKLYAVGPITIMVVGLFLIPFGLLLGNAFLSRVGYGSAGLPLTFSNLEQVLHPFYLGIFFKSLVVAAGATAITFLIGIGCAFYLAKCVSGRMQAVLLFLLVLPFWTSYLARIYGWFFLLGASGPVSRFLVWAGIIEAPRTLLFNFPAFFAGLVYNNLPYMILPIYGVLSRIEDDVIQAAYDLYATDWQLFRRVIVPLTAPGWLAGGVLVFVSCLSDFACVEILYGSKSVFAANLIQSQFLIARNWPLGSAMAMLFLISIAAALGWTCWIIYKHYPHVFRRDELLAGLEGSVSR